MSGDENLADYLERCATGWDALHMDTADDFRKAAKLLRMPYIAVAIAARAKTPEGKS